MSSHDIRDREFDDWPVQGRENRDTRYVGTAGAGAGAPVPFVFYDPESRTIFGGRLDEERETVVPDTDHEWDVDPEETVGEAVERLGEELDWDSLSTFAEEHLLEDGSESDS